MVETFDCKKTSLKRGAKGAQVTLLQTHLKTLGYYVKIDGYSVKVDGDYGKYTEKAVKAFQKATGNVQDGWFGEQTCKSLNSKLSVDPPKKQETTPEQSKGNSSNSIPVEVVKPVDPYKADPKKNVWTVHQANLSVDRIYLIVSNITFTNNWKAPTWKRIDLMDGGQYRYLSNVAPREYSVDCIMTRKEFDQLSNEFYKMMHRTCRVLTRSLFPAANYTVDVSVAYQNVQTRKVTLKFTECI